MNFHTLITWGCKFEGRQLFVQGSLFSACSGPLMLLKEAKFDNICMNYLMLKHP